MPPKKAAKAAPEPPVPFAEWPAPAKVALARSLVRFNRLDTVTNVCKNIANLACTCREMRAICKDVLPMVAAAVELGPNDPQTPWWEGAPPPKRLEATAFPFDPTYRGPWPLTSDEVKAEVEHGEFEGSLLSPRLAAEMMRLASRYLPESRACKEYALDPKDLKAVEEVTVGQPGQGLGYMHLRRLSDVAAVAQAKHRTFDALQALLKAEGERERERKARKGPIQVVKETWIREHTRYNALVAAEESYANIKRIQAIKNEALADFVAREWGGDVDAATHSPAVKSAPKEAQRSIAATIRAAWKAAGGAAGGGRQGQAAREKGGAVGGADSEGDWETETE